MKSCKNINKKNLQKKKKLQQKIEIKFDWKKTWGWWNLKKQIKIIPNKVNCN